MAVPADLSGPRPASALATFCDFNGMAKLLARVIVRIALQYQRAWLGRRGVAFF